MARGAASRRAAGDTRPPFEPPSLLLVPSFVPPGRHFEEPRLRRDHWGEAGLAPGDDRWQAGAAKEAVILGFGAFLGEVLRRTVGGEWQEDPAQADNVLAARVVLPGGHRIFPISRVFKRLRDGSRDRLEPLYRLARDETGAKPSTPEVDGWVRQARHFAGVSRPDLAGRFCERALARGPAPQGAEIEALRAAAERAAQAAEGEARERATAAARASLAERAEEGRQRLASFGIRVEHGALTLLGLDTFLDATLGPGPVGGRPAAAAARGGSRSLPRRAAVRAVPGPVA